MKKLYSFIVISLFSASVFAQCTAVTMCPQVNPYTGNVRGYYFAAPINFTICGLFIPTDASTLPQSIEVVRFDSVAPPAYPAFTNAFTSLFYTSLDPSATMIPCNIPVLMGDTIGVYGARGNTTVNSYIMAACGITILGNPVTIYRSGMQFPLWSQQMQDIWSEVANSPSSTIMYVSSGAGVNEISLSTPINVSPNPSSGLFTYYSTITEGTAEVFNLLGEKIHSQPVQGSSDFTIDISAQPKGIYFLRVSSVEGKTGVAKLVVE